MAGTMGSDGFDMPVMIEHVWVLADEPDPYVAAAIIAIEERYAPERTEEEIRWIAPAETEGQ